MATTHEARFLLTAKDRTEVAMSRAKKNILGVGSAARQATSMIGGLVGAAGFGMLMRQAIETGSALSDMATATNTNVEAFQALLFAAEEAGASQQDLARALRNIQQRAIEAKNGTTSYADAMDRLGIDTETFIGLPTERKLEAIGQALVDSTDKQQAYADIIRFVGEESGPKLIEALQRLGTEGFDEVSTAAALSGAIMKEEVVKRMDDAADAIQKFKRRITNFTAIFASAALEMGDDFGTAFAGMINSIEGLKTTMPNEDDGAKDGAGYGSTFRVNLERELNRSATTIESQLTRIFSDFSDGAKGIVSNLGDFIISEITEAFAKSFIVNPLMGFLGLGGSAAAPDGKNVPFNFLSKMMHVLPGFAGGGDFTVGGSGGTDTSLVAFRATPGERVSVTRPGQGDGGGAAVNVFQTFQPGVSPEAMAFAMNQTKRETMAAVQEGLRRNPNFGRRA